MQPSHRASTHLKCVTLLYLLRILTVLAIFATAAWSVYTKDVFWLGISGGLLGAFALIFLLMACEAGSCRCAVCRTPLFQSSKRNGRVHQQSRQIFGSHRLRRCFQILLRSYYRCTHCGERVAASEPEREAVAHMAPSHRMSSLPSTSVPRVRRYSAKLK